MIEGQIPIEDYKTGNTKHTWDTNKIQAAHKIIAEYNFKKGEIKRGYANRTLYINLSIGTIKEKPVTEEMKKKFTGGRGFGLKLLWDSIKPTTRWDSEENELIITTGPLSRSRMIRKALCDYFRRQAGFAMSKGGWKKKDGVWILR